MVSPGAVPAGRHRLVVRPHDIPERGVTITFQVGTIDADLDAEQRRQIETVLVDPLLETGRWDEPVGAGQLDIGLIPGVTDTAAASFRYAATLLGIPVRDVAVGRLIDIDVNHDTADTAGRTWANAVIERWAVGHAVEPGYAAPAAAVTATESVPLPDDDEALTTLGRERGLALDLAELHVIRRHFADLGRDPTDAELETLAQTWSEHCAHKSFRAEIIATEPDGSPLHIDPLLTQLR
ncbi:MAG TPA: hypothetical protein PLV68_05935, partial [Ilumatobacteraceae bacterium]|nr:hypothetical protein [Ilumatobacteraceae bacterium]